MLSRASLLAFFVLLCVQVSVALLYKLSQTGDGRGYSYSPLSAMCLAEMIKCTLASSMFLAGVRQDVRRAREKLAPGPAPAGGGGEGDSVSTADSDIVSAGSGSDGAIAVETDELAETEKSSLTGENSPTGGATAAAAAATVAATAAATAAASADEARSRVLDEDADLLVAGESFWKFAGYALRLFRSLLSSKALRAHVLILALGYFALNQLQFLVLTLVDTATEALVHSSTTIVAALLLWSAFAREIRGKQWLALVLQIAGVATVLWDPTSTSSASSSAPSSGALVLLLFSVSLSACCSVYNEFVVKRFGAPHQLMAQNALLYALGSAINLLFFFVGPDLYARTSVADASTATDDDGSAAAGTGVDGTGHVASAGAVSGTASHAHPSFFSGYTSFALLLVLCNSLLGLVITAVYKYADALVKTFASACATAALFLINAAFFGKELRAHVMLGVVAVFAASAGYFRAAAPSSTARTTTQEPVAAEEESAGETSVEMASVSSSTAKEPEQQSQPQLQQSDMSETASLTAESAGAGDSSTVSTRSDDSSKGDEMRFVCFEREQRPRLVVVLLVACVVTGALLLNSSVGLSGSSALPDDAALAALAALSTGGANSSDSVAASSSSSSTASAPAADASTASLATGAAV